MQSDTIRLVFEGAQGTLLGLSREAAREDLSAAFADGDNIDTRALTRPVADEPVPQDLMEPIR